MEKHTKPIVSILTLGCKVNQYETQALKEKFIASGYEIGEEEGFANVYVINTCTVTGLSDRKSRQYIRRVKRINPDSITAVIGCYAQVSPEEASAIEGVNIVAGTNEKNNLVEYIENYKRDREIDTKERVQEKLQDVECHIKPLEELTEYEESGIITSMDSRTRAFIKIQEGCNRFCSYCIIPYARGSVRSRAKEEIVKEAKSLIEKGFKELVLTGINAALYGTEEGFSKETAGISGIEMIVKALDNLPGDFRIRLSSLEPTVINAQYVKNLLQYKKLCPHLHLSLQSGSDQILNAMNRNYDSAEYLEIVNILKDHDRGYGITTDIIVGFPGETEENFRQSIQLVEQVGFCKVHVFKYSKRQGTKAADMKVHLSPEVKGKRSALLIETGEQASKAFCLKNKGMRRTVLIEKLDEKTGYLEGFSENYMKVYVKGAEALINHFVTVRIDDCYGDGVIGILEEESSLNYLS